MALIMVVDDSLFMRGLIGEILRLEGHQIIEADGGRRALSLLAEHEPDCMLLDLNMPDMSGFEVLQTLRGQGSTLPVIVLTADVQESVRSQCFEQGARTVLHKPPQHEELARAMAAVIPEREGVRV